MSSPQGGSSRAFADDSRDENYHQDAQPPSLSSDDDIQHDSPRCPWRTLAFHDQECSRYFDCPSHLLERKLSADAQAGHDTVTVEEGTSANPEVEAAENNDSDPAMLSIENLHISTTSQPQAGIENHNEASLNSSSGPSPAASLSASSSPVPTSPAADMAENTSRSAPRRTPPQQEAGQQTGLGLLEDQTVTGDIQGLPSVLSTATGRQNTPTLPPLNSASSQQGDGRHSQSSPQTGQPGHGRRSISTVPSIPQRQDSLPSSVSAGLGRALASSAQLQTQREGQLEQAPSFLHPRTAASGPPLTLPRWQPDGQATYCPICRTQFSFFIRKHHCRRCGRVVCNSCSPHRIIIPHQYIVRPPGSDYSMPSNLLVGGLGSGYFDADGMPGGERVRLCNPCVPDPNTAPPQSPPTPSASAPPQSSHHRSRSGMTSAFGTVPDTNRYGAVFTAGGGSGDPLQYYASRSRSITMVSFLTCINLSALTLTLRKEPFHAGLRARSNGSSTLEYIRATAKPVFQLLQF